MTERIRFSARTTEGIDVLIRGISIGDFNDGPVELDSWPFDVPAVAQIARAGLELTSPVTFLVGENGSGKSTVVEAIAEAWGIDPRGGRGKVGRAVEPERSSRLARALRLDLTAEGRKFQSSKMRSRSFFLRAETAFDLVGFISSFNVILPGYWQEDLRVRSHGEGFLTVFGSIFTESGLYLMDEPEAALSFTACLQLVASLHDLGDLGAQVICATHSPVLAATPGADILELTDEGIARTAWDDLELVEHWRAYLDDPRRYLRRLVGEEP